MFTRPMRAEFSESKQIHHHHSSRRILNEAQKFVQRLSMPTFSPSMRSVAADEMRPRFWGSVDTLFEHDDLPGVMN